MRARRTRRVHGWAARIGILAVASGCAGLHLGATREEVLERILPSPVQIIVERNGQRFRTGSGVVIAAGGSGGDTDCFVLTSGHTFAALTDHDRAYVLFGRSRGAGSRVPATVEVRRESDEVDLALLRARTLQCSPVGFGRPPGLGERIWVIGFPWGKSMMLMGGIVSQVNLDEPGDRETAPRLMVDASVSYGTSGGAFTRNGRDGSQLRSQVHEGCASSRALLSFSLAEGTYFPRRA